jgi:hypothetical protein
MWFAPFAAQTTSKTLDFSFSLWGWGQPLHCTLDCNRRFEKCKQARQVNKKARHF